jgi:hypothetical protein
MIFATVTRKLSGVMLFFDTQRDRIPTPGAKIALTGLWCSTPRKKKEITDLNTKLYVDRYNTVKAENDKFKKTWDGIVNTDFINDLKVNTTSRERRT